MVGMTCAVKNLFGTVPGLSKAEFHMRFPTPEDFGSMLADLCEAVRPDMVVADGIVAMEGDGPASGTPYALGLILGGQSAYDVDLAVCRIMGISPQRVPYLAAAVRRGLCAGLCPVRRNGWRPAQGCAGRCASAAENAPGYAPAIPSGCGAERRISPARAASAASAAMRCAR